MCQYMTVADILNRGIAVTIKGGYDAGYVTQPGYTVVQGGLTVVSGKLIADHLVIK